MDELRTNHCQSGEREAILDKLAEFTRAIFWEIDARGLITSINPVVEVVLGYRPDELVGRMHVFDFIPDERRDEFRISTLEAFAERRAFRNYANPVLTRDGEPVWMLANGIPVQSPDGNLKGYKGISVDITDRKRSEKALMVKNYTFDLSIAANSIADTGGLITEVNNAFLKLWGYPDRSEVVGKPISHFLDDPETAAEILETLAEKAEWEGNYRAVRRDGSFFIAHGLATTLVDADGRHIGYQSSVIDVSRSKKIEMKLRESEARNRALLNALPDIIFILNEEGVFVDYHAASGDQLLLPPEAFMGKRIQDVLPGEISDPTFAGIQDVRNGLEASPIRYEADIAGVTHFYESRIVACGDDRFLSIVRDITDLRLGEQEQEKLQAQLRQAHKMESVGRLAGGVAHDFNNMLGVILGHVEMAMDKIPPSHPAMEDLQEIHCSAERSADLTRQLLAFARRQPVAPRVLDVNATLQGMLNMLRRQIGEDIELRCRLGKNLWPVRVDPSQIGQMLANLCINARQALPGAGWITIETANDTLNGDFCRENPGSTPGDYVVLTISDNGIGMDRETMDHIFEPFFTTRTPGYGTGLGLSTVYGIVKQSKGYINVESEPGKGSAFRVYLPRSDNPVEPVSKNTVISVSPGGSETIILVEDEKAILDLTGAMLENLGYTVLYASKPSEALDLARTHKNAVRLLITDVIMPEQNGRDLAWSLKNIIPELKCLFMSGYTANVIAHHGVLEEGVHFIAKPFNSRKLAVAVRRILDGEDAVQGYLLQD